MCSLNELFYEVPLKTMEICRQLIKCQDAVPGDYNKRDPERENWPCRVMLPILPIQSISGSRLLSSPGIMCDLKTRCEKLQISAIGHQPQMQPKETRTILFADRLKSARWNESDRVGPFPSNAKKLNLANIGVGRIQAHQTHQMPILNLFGVLRGWLPPLPRSPLL